MATTDCALDEIDSAAPYNVEPASLQTKSEKHHKFKQGESGQQVNSVGLNTEHKQDTLGQSIQWGAGVGLSQESGSATRWTAACAQAVNGCQRGFESEDGCSHSAGGEEATHGSSVRDGQPVKVDCASRDGDHSMRMFSINGRVPRVERADCHVPVNAQLIPTCSVPFPGNTGYTPGGSDNGSGGASGGASGVEIVIGAYSNRVNQSRCLARAQRHRRESTGGANFGVNGSYNIRTRHGGREQ
eukprot:5664994-Prymnesium_polylepis.1